MSAGNYLNPSSQGQSQGAQGQGQAHHDQQQRPLTRNNLSRLPFTPNINHYQHQDSSYERRNLGESTHSGRQSTSRYLQNFDAQFYGAASGSGSSSYGGYSGGGSRR